MTYFEHPYVSNSDLNGVKDLTFGREKPVNIQAIYDQGTLNHHALIEPHKADKTHKDYILAKTMAQTVLEDDMCRSIILSPDLRREHEWYRTRNEYGLIGMKCKADLSSKLHSVVFEYKGLSVATQDAFINAVERLNYDQSAAWYLDITGFMWYLIVAVSKLKPKKLFKLLITRDHKYYHSGKQKVLHGVREWKNWDFK